MEQVAITFIQRLNGVEIAILLLAAIGFLVYLVTHARRDKQGKWYIYNKTYELQKGLKNSVEAKLDDHVKTDRADLQSINSTLGSLQSAISDLQVSDKSQTMESLKQSVFMEKMPIRERLFAGLKFVKAGGNSETRKELVGLIREHREVYDGICMGRPDLKLEFREGDI